MKKLVIIGAGSVVFTKGIINNLLCSMPGGHQWEIALCDTNEISSNNIVKLAKKMLAIKETTVHLSWSTDRCDLLSDADYVISTIGVGGRRAWEQDVFIPRKYGINQPVGDTAMAGGISRAMRMVPALIEIVNDVHKLAPQAYFFNYSNPMAVICRALRKATAHEVTGLCHGVSSSEKYIASILGCSENAISTLAAGINHCTFIYDIRVNGKNVIPDLHDILQRGKEPLKISREPFCWDFFKKYNAFPAPGDRHVSEFFTEYFPNGDYYGRKLGFDAFSFEHCILEGDNSYDHIANIANSHDPLPVDFLSPVSGGRDQLMSIIDSIENDSRIISYMNVPNQNALTNLPPWTILEIPCAATSNGPKPMIIDNFTDILAGFTMRFCSNIEIIVEAALKGDRNLWVEAVLADRSITNRISAESMVDELIKTQKAYLPQFA